MDAYQKFKNDQTGTAAVEFAILAPMFLIILAGIVNIGLALNWKIAAEARVSALSNFAIVSNLDFTDEQSALDFLDQAKSLFSQSPIQPYSSEHENLTINVNNSIELKIAGGQASTNNSGSTLDECYCPTYSSSIVIWGNQFDCTEACPNGHTAAHYIEITAENEMPLAMITGQIFSIANIQFTSLVRMD